MPKTQVFPIAGFRGVDELLIPGIGAPTTRDSRNVWARFNTINDRNGVAKLGGSTPADSAIDGLFEYYTIAGTFYLIRITTTAVAEYHEATNVWADITGTALTGTSGTLVDATLIDDTFVFTNAKDKIRKWAATGNTDNIAGGDNIYGKTVCEYDGFLLVGNWSSDGSTFHGVEIIYADDWDTSGSWDPCAPNIVVVDETPGEILKMAKFGRSVMVYKTDGVVKLTYLSAQQGWRHELMPFDLGILAPNSLVDVSRIGHIFMATDKQLYVNDGTNIKPIAPNVSEELRLNMIDAYANKSCAANDFTRTTYSLFYPKTTSATYLDGRIDFNYLTNEFAKGDYQDAARKFHRTAKFTFADSNTVQSSIVASDDNKLVYRIDSGQDDDGTTPTRYYTTDWTNLNWIGDKYLRGGNFIFTRSPGARVRISVAQDYQKQFRYPQTFSLGGLDTDSTEVLIKYDITPIMGQVFNFKIECFRDFTTSTNAMKVIYARFTPISGDQQESQPRPQATRG
jgi:hypothetical protein